MRRASAARIARSPHLAVRCRPGEYGYRPVAPPVVRQPPAPMGPGHPLRPRSAPDRAAMPRPGA
jgi:hypothetical protein